MGKRGDKRRRNLDFLIKYKHLLPDESDRDLATLLVGRPRSETSHGRGKNYWRQVSSLVMKLGLRQKTGVVDYSSTVWASSVVYGILASDNHGQDNNFGLKIGVSDNIKKRFDSLQHANPLPLTLAWMVRVPSLMEARRIEKALHLEFRTYRLHGEWFAPGVKDAAYSLAQHMALARQIPSLTDRNEAAV